MAPRRDVDTVTFVSLGVALDEDDGLPASTLRVPGNALTTTDLAIGDWVVARTEKARATAALQVLRGSDYANEAAVSTATATTLGQGTLYVRRYGVRDRARRLWGLPGLVIALGLLVALSGAWESRPWKDEGPSTSDYRAVVDDLAFQLGRTDDAVDSAAEQIDTVATALSDADAAGEVRAVADRLVHEAARATGTAERLDEEADKAETGILDTVADWIKVIGGLLIAALAAWQALGKNSVPA